uniref:Helicase C-terminal domain-containing protein n=1 Tax=Calcidiscus leptoporus TaxID=127549 RepID=A0A7S0P4C0_9EUKA
MCREPISREKLLTVPRASRFAVDPKAEWRSSAKIDALLCELRALSHFVPEQPTNQRYAKDHVEDVATRASARHVVKSVVFSQWTAMLDLVAIALERESLGFCRLDGAMGLEERQRSLRSFRNDSSMRVLLLSLKAGNVGLNLTAAQHVYLLDPWWNPAVEEQAMGRVHRIGQHHEVTVTRLVVRGTVEEKILELQERKRHLCHLALSTDTKEHEMVPANVDVRNRQMRLADLALCFQ